MTSCRTFCLHPRLTLVTIQNLAFYLDFMRKLREAIKNDTVAEFYQKVCALYPH
ncbi:MAG: hypothetical protein JSR57_10760 [Verrucomicrobia bacterium]|nr:hypothetical protein [Verrucomicrobiota bacterium]